MSIYFRYHPSLMAVIAVGDFIGSEQTIVDMLRDYFDDAVNAHWLDAHPPSDSIDPLTVAADGFKSTSDGEEEEEENITPGTNEPKQAVEGVDSSLVVDEEGLVLVDHLKKEKQPNDDDDMATGEGAAKEEIVVSDLTFMKELPTEPDRCVSKVFGQPSVCVVMKDPEATYSQANVTWKTPLPSNVRTIYVTLSLFLSRILSYPVIQCVEKSCTDRVYIYIHSCCPLHL
jgi:hypothetical protein